MAVRIWRQKITVTAVKMMEKAADSHTELATYFRIPAWSPAPNLWETGMEKPMQTPMQKPMTRKFTEEVEPTAAKGSTPK